MQKSTFKTYEHGIKSARFAYKITIALCSPKAISLEDNAVRVEYIIYTNSELDRNSAIEFVKGCHKRKNPVFESLELLYDLNALEKSWDI